MLSLLNLFKRKPKILFRSPLCHMPVHEFYSELITQGSKVPMDVLERFSTHMRVLSGRDNPGIYWANFATTGNSPDIGVTLYTRDRAIMFSVAGNTLTVDCGRESYATEQPWTIYGWLLKTFDVDLFNYLKI